MGIKCLNATIHRTYKQCSNSYSVIGDGKKCDNLFIDANCIFLTSIFQCQGDGEKLTDEMFHNIFYNFNALIHMVQPENLLFISCEGSVSMARWWTKGTRKINLADKFPHKKKYFFKMIQIIPKLNEYIKNKIESDPIWGRIKKIIISPDNVPGEGEMKIFQHIKYMQHSKEYDPNQINMIYSSDSDQILLSLLSHEQNIYILSRNFEYNRCDTPLHSDPSLITKSSTNIIDISILRQILFAVFNKVDEKIMNDIGFISLVLGNDYMPKIEGLESVKFDTVIKCYKENFAEFNKYIIEDNKINWEMFSQFLKCLYKLYNNRDFNESYVAKPKEKEYARKALEAFEWTHQCHEKCVPSWSWSYGERVEPDISAIIKEIEEYHPEFPLKDDPYADHKPSIIMRFMLIDKVISEFFPEELQKLKEEDPYLSKLFNNLVLGGISFSDVKENIKIEQKVKEMLATSEKDYSYFTEIGSNYDIKTGEKIQYKDECFVFVDKLKSAEENFSKIKMNNDLMDICIPENGEDLIGKTCTLIPYGQNVIVEEDVTNVTVDFQKFYGIFIMPNEKFVKVRPINRKTGFPSDNSLIWPKRFCRVNESLPKFIPESLNFTCDFKEYDSRSKFNTNDEIARKCSCLFKDVFPAVVNLHVRKNDNYSLQLVKREYRNSHPFYTGVIPFYSQYSWSNGKTQILLSDSCCESINKLISIIGIRNCDQKKPLKLNEEKFEELRQFLTEFNHQIPWFIDKNSDTFNIEKVRVIEEEVIKGVHGKKLVPNINIRPELGKCIAIIDDSTPAQVGNTGVIIGINNKKKEAWVIMHEFADGTTLGHSLKGYNGAIIPFESFVVLA